MEVGITIVHPRDSVPTRCQLPPPACSQPLRGPSAITRLRQTLASASQARGSVGARHRAGVGRRIAIALGLAVAAFAATAPARADAYEAALTRAVAAKEQALDANDPVSWETALSRFLEVRAIAETDEAMYELGLVATRLHQDDLAVEAYAAALELGLSGEPRAKAQAFVDAAAGRMASLTVEGPPGTVVLVAGRPRGVLPMKRPLTLFPGRVVLSARLADGRPLEHRVVLAEGDAASVRLEEPALLASAGEPAEPGARGEHPLPSVVVSDPPPPAPSSASQPASSTVATSSVLLWTGGALVALSAVAVPLASLRIGGARDELSRNCPEPSDDACPGGTEPENQVAAQRAVDDIATYKWVRTGAWIGAGVGVAVFATGLALRLSDSDSSETAMCVTALPGGAGLSLGRRF